MKAKSIKGKTTEDIKVALGESMADSFSPTVAVVFIANDNEQKNIVTLLSEKKFRCSELQQVTILLTEK